MTMRKVSIAGAILWGVLRVLYCSWWTRAGRFQSQGRFFGGCCLIIGLIALMMLMFQSQGRFFGGCCDELFHGFVLR